MLPKGNRLVRNPLEGRFPLLHNCVTEANGGQIMEATMGYQVRREYFRTQCKRYFEANRAGKEGMLDEAQAMFGLNRKSLVRAFARALQPGGPPRRGTPARYG